MARETRVSSSFSGVGWREQAGRLVDDQDVRVLVQDPEPAGDLAGFGAAWEEGHPVARVVGHLAARLVGHGAVDLDPTIADRLLGGPPRQREAVGDQLIQANRHDGDTRTGTRRNYAPASRSQPRGRIVSGRVGLSHRLARPPD